MRHVAQPPRGRYSVFTVDEATGLWVPRCLNRANQIQFDWARIALQAIGKGQSKYRISTIYVEFQNVASPGDPGSVPAYDRDEGVEYYTGLAGDRDYLRLPLLSEPVLSVSAAGTPYFEGEGDDFDTMTFFAQTSGALGVNGLEFSSSANSLAVGIALVATPVPADRTRDVVFGRAYFALDEQVPKEASHQIAVSWEQTFG